MRMRKSRLSQVKQDCLLEHFVQGRAARCAADLVGVNFKTAAYYYHRLREIICLAVGAETPFTGEITSTESKISGTRPSDTCGNLTVFLPGIFRYF